jgi:hypothetical protein
VRWLECQHLVAFRERGFDLDERCAGARRDDELGRIVGDDAAVRARIEDLAFQRLAVPVLGAAAADA